QPRELGDRIDGGQAVTLDELDGGEAHARVGAGQLADDDAERPAALRTEGPQGVDGPALHARVAIVRAGREIGDHALAAGPGPRQDVEGPDPVLRRRVV